MADKGIAMQDAEKAIRRRVFKTVLIQTIRVQVTDLIAIAMAIIILASVWEPMPGGEPRNPSTVSMDPRLSSD